MKLALTFPASHCCLGLLLAIAGSAWAGPVLTVAWRDKPPYHYLEKEIPTGFLLDRSQRIFSAAGIPVRFVSEPQKRIWANFEHGARNYCSISWYRLPEREALAQYSLPIHTDPPHSILIAPGALSQVKAHATLASLLADSSLTLGVVDGVSYGHDIDSMIARSGNQIMRRTVDVNSMIRMLSVGRASYMFVDREDWAFLSKREPQLRAATRHDFPDMPPGLKRHIVCSKDVPAATMSKINQAISAELAQPRGDERKGAVQ
ncbi:transporter substrate-binding domain-containing protein [Oxalobacteraceae bacterium]|nr:transporter substrate-binding domain-containing protein [Oxalobacteraceae bacterium]